MVVVGFLFGWWCFWVVVLLTSFFLLRSSFFVLPSSSFLLPFFCNVWEKSNTVKVPEVIWSQAS